MVAALQEWQSWFAHIEAEDQLEGQDRAKQVLADVEGWLDHNVPEHQAFWARVEQACPGVLPLLVRGVASSEPSCEPDFARDCAHA